MNTKLIQLLDPRAEGTAIFRSFGGVRKAGSDDGGIQIDLVLYWPIRTSHEAKELEPVIAGAGVMYADRDSRDDDDPAKSDHTSTRKFQDDSRHVTLHLVQDGAEGGGRVILSDQSCSVIQAAFKTSKKAASYEVKIRVFGLTAKQVGEIAEGLTSHVGVSLETDQAALVGAGSNVRSLEAHRKALIPKVGQIVVGKLASGAEFAGTVAQVNTEDGKTLVEVEDLDGTTVEVTADRVTSALTIVPPRGKTVDGMLDSYREKAAKKGTHPTVAAIVQALGEIHSQDLSPTESWTLSAAVIDAAAKIQVLPPEVDEDEDEPVVAAH